MAHIGQLIEFSSSAFPPCKEDEEELVNHDTMHGYALARYVADHLPAHGFDLADMVGEDWGWWCAIKNEGYTLAYGCSGDRGEDFILQVTPDKPQIRRWFKKIDVADRVEGLLQAIFKILADSGQAKSGPTWSG